MLKLTIELEREADGRWIAEVRELPGAAAYGATRDEAVRACKALALHVVADRLENGEDVFTGRPQPDSTDSPDAVSFNVAA
jgi:predicted RNase H-like HicB family nuclease